MLPVNQILHGDALGRLKSLPDNTIDTCITSPPYWGLRDYKHSDQLGMEPIIYQYLDNLIEIFAQVKRVIKKTGSIWVNIGDTYDENKSLCGIPERFAIRMTDKLGLIRRNTVIWYKPNCMPSSASDRFTVDFEYIYFFTKSQKYHFETQYEELVLEDDKVDNAVKMGWDGQSDYTDWYFNDRQKVSWHDHSNDDEQGFGQQTRGQKPKQIHHPLGRQKRCVWKISTRAFSDAHFAVYPSQLIEPIIKAACPEWICSSCGKPRKLVYEEKQLIPTHHIPDEWATDCKSRTDDDPHKGLHSSEWSKGKPKVVRMPKFGGNKAEGYGNPTYSGKEWNPLMRRLKSMGADNNGEYHGQATKDYDLDYMENPSDRKRRILESYKKRANSDLVMTDCSCNTGFDNGICLDPFFGSGTTGLVALQLGRKFIGIELNQDYIDIAMKRLKPLLLQTKLM